VTCPPPLSLLPVTGGLTVCSRSPCLLSPSSMSPLPSLMASDSLVTTLFAQGSKLPRSLVLFHRHHLQFFFQIFFFASFHPHPYDPSPFDLLFLFSQAHPLKFNIGPFFPSFLSALMMALRLVSLIYRPLSIEGHFPCLDGAQGVRGSALAETVESCCR